MKLHGPAKLLHGQGVTLRFDISASVWRRSSKPILSPAHKCGIQTSRVTKCGVLWYNNLSSGGANITDGSVYAIYFSEYFRPFDFSLTFRTRFLDPNQEEYFEKKSGKLIYALI